MLGDDRSFSEFSVSSKQSGAAAGAEWVGVVDTIGVVLVGDEPAFRLVERVAEEVGSIGLRVGLSF